MLVLIHVHEDGTLNKHPLRKLPVTVGRGAEATVTIDDDSLSKLHARIYVKDRRLYVNDLDSELGVFIDGEAVTDGPIKLGHEVRMGAVKLKVMKAKEPGADPSRSGAGGAKAGGGSGAASTDFGVEEFTLPGMEEGDAPATSRPSPANRSSAGPAGAAPSRPDPSGRPVGARPKGGAATSGPQGVKIKQDILQYNKIDAKAGRTFLRNDFSQYGGVVRVILFAVILALAAGAFFLFKWVGTEMTPTDLSEDGAVEEVEK